MSSPFKEVDTRAKLLLWALGILLFGVIYLRNADTWGQQLTSIIDEAEQFEQYFEAPQQQLFSGDIDGDGLDNVLEVALQGDPSVVDTDTDGFTDYEEFLSGYPLDTPGQTELTEQQLDEYFTAFESQYDGPYYIQTDYYNQRVAGLLEQDKASEAILLLDRDLPKRALQELENHFLSVEDYSNMLLVAERKVVLYEDDPASLFSAGYAAHLQDQLDLALTYYRQAEALNSDDAALYNNIGVILVSQGDLVEGVEYYQQAVELAPNEAIYLENIISGYQDLGLSTEAAVYSEQLEQLIDKNTDSQ